MTDNAQMADSGGNGSERRKTAFEREFERFYEDLKQKKNKRDFVERISQNGQSSPDRLKESVGQLVKKPPRNPRLRKVHNGLRSVTETLRDYGDVVDTMIQAYPFPTALIWGGLKIVLECVQRHEKQVGLIEDAVQKLPDILLDLLSFESLYSESIYHEDAVQRILSTSYKNILLFWYRSTKIMENPKIASLTGKGDKNLEKLVNELENNRDSLVLVRNTNEAHLNHDMPVDLNSDSKKAEEERLEAEKERKLAEEERHKAEEERQRVEKAGQLFLAEKKRKATEQNWKDLKKAFGSRVAISYASYENAQTDRHQGTCQWLFDYDMFSQWAETSSSSSFPILWLNGKHGAGKSVLCAAAIDHIKESIKVKSGLGDTPVVAFHFFTKDEYVSKSQVLRNIAGQLLLQVKRATETVVAVNSNGQSDVFDFPKSLERFLDLNGDRSADVEDLIRALLQEISLAYIFLDGLDEAEYTDDQLRPTTARADDVQAVVRFLATEAVSAFSPRSSSSPSPPLPPSKIRLWCSSQPLPEISELMCGQQNPWKDGVHELSLQRRHTEKDILNYIISAIPESTKDKAEFAQLFATAGVASEAEGSFLWARTMLDELKLETEDDDELFDLVKGGLPSKMSDIYERVMARIKARLHSRRDGLPLWKIILSLVTFSKRPLRIAEVIEAVAIFRTADGYNLNTNKVTTADRILKCCLSLVRLGPKAENEALLDQVLRLSHSAVRAFLLRHSDVSTSGKENEEYVTKTVIQDCCFRYLRQPRYDHLLVLDPVCPTVFRTHSGEEVARFHMLSYAAKYWFQHFDVPEPFSPPPSSSSNHKQVVAFLQSPHFQTCIQIQCLFVVGHFLQRFDPITDQCTTLRRTLPNWIVQNEPDLMHQYVAFQSEWCHLLQAVQNGQLGGQVDRCFWSALGPGNFLSRNVSRYQSFVLGNTCDMAGGNVCQVLQVAPSGDCFTICSVKDNSDTKSLHVETWSIDRVHTPQKQSIVDVPFCPGKTNLECYWLPCSSSLRYMPLVPDVKCVTVPAVISVGCEHAAVMRIGSQIFMKQPSSSETAKFVQEESRALGTFWEEIAVHGSYMVMCRRRVPRPQPPADERVREMKRARLMRERQIKFPEFERSRSRRRHTKRSRFDSDDSDDSDNDLPFFVRGLVSALSASDSSHSSHSDGDDTNDTNDASSGIFSPPDSEDDDLLDIPSALESWSEGSTSTDSSSSSDSFNSGEEESDGDNDDSADESDQLKDNNSSGSDIASALSLNDSSDDTDSEAGSIASQLSIVPVVGSDSESDSESDSFDSSPGSSKDKQEESQEKEADGEAGAAVHITAQRYLIYCDGCYRGPMRAYYRCIKCSSNNESNDKSNSFDLCLPCEQRGRWCMNQGHQLCKIDHDKVVRMVSRSNFRIRQELKVVHLGEKSEETQTDIKVVFDIKKKYNSLLYRSPPIIHPIHPLAVWALTGKKLLFANFGSNTFFEQKIRPVGKAQTVCVSLSFSPCGSYLRVASVDVPNTPKSRGSKRPSTTAKAADNLLRLNIWVLRLSVSNPAKNIPKLVSSTSFFLGPASLGVVQQIPFTFTWAPAELYVTVSGLRLNVYRVVLPADRTGPCLPAKKDTPVLPVTSLSVTKPGEEIYLPRSSRHRSVQFFPPRTPGDHSVIVIGPRFGRHREPPIVVYLTNKDLGGWVDAMAVSEVNGQGPARPKLEGQLEDFEERQDCDLISLQ